jgi:hypothetical protein
MMTREMAFFRFHRPGASRRPTLLGQAVAWLAVGLIGLLTWLAVDPEAHEFFHPDAAGHTACAHGHAGGAHEHATDPAGSPSENSHDEHECIVTAFAAGATDLLVFVLLACAGLSLAAHLVPTLALIARASPHFRHAPSCGPPVCA